MYFFTDDNKVDSWQVYIVLIHPIMATFIGGFPPLVARATAATRDSALGVMACRELFSWLLVRVAIPRF